MKFLYVIDDNKRHRWINRQHIVSISSGEMGTGMTIKLSTGDDVFIPASWDGLQETIRILEHE